MNPDDRTAAYLACRKARTHRPGRTQTLRRPWNREYLPFGICAVCGVPVAPKPAHRMWKIA